jgi:hypothetical protein
MAIFRKIHTSFWSDSFISDLDAEKKLFYLYIMTNERTKQCGVYEITIRQISFDLGYSIDKVSKLIEYFTKTGKVRYNDVTKELALGNWLKYNNSSSPKVKTCIDSEFKQVKDTLLIEYVKSMDTQSQEEQEEEEEKEQEEDVNKSEFVYGKKGGLKKQKFSPPVIGDVEAFFELKGFSKEFARTAFDHYDLANWFDSNGKQVISWKSKMNTNWLTAENKLKHGLNANSQNGKTIIKLGNIVS